MTRPRLSAPSIAPLSVALLLPLACISSRAFAAESYPPANDRPWATATAAANPFRPTAAPEWTPVRSPQPAMPQRSAVLPAASNQFQATSPSTASVPPWSVPPSKYHGPSQNAPQFDRPKENAAPNWQLPNSKLAAGHENRPAPSNPMAPAPRRMLGAPPREPNSFTPPGNVSRIASPPRNVAGAAIDRDGTIASLFVQQPAASPAPPRRRVQNLPNPTPTSNRTAVAGRREVTQIPPTRPTTPGRLAADPRSTPGKQPGPARFSSKADNYSGRMWDSIAVAFQAPETWTEESPQPESLPMPGGTNAPRSNSSAGSNSGGQTQVMTGPEFSGGEPYDVYDGNAYDIPGGGCNCPGGCAECGPMCGGGMCGCEPGCGCGCGGEIGCGCEPGCGCSGGGRGGCDVNCCGEGDPAACTTVRIGVPKWQEFVIFGGVQGFKGPYDQFRDSGNFGFHEGFNTGFKVPFSTMGYQFGYRGVHSQLSGDKDTDIADPHTQQFVTAGVFQRVKDGIQGGIVWDMLRDERWGAVDFHQLRAEVSMIDQGCHEWGVSATVHLNDDEQFFFFDDDEDIFSIIYQASDQYLAFYRFHGRHGGEGRFYGGFNDDSDGIIGADMLLPLQDRWSLSAAFTYLIPDESGGEIGAQQEAWNLSMALVWHWDCRARKSHSNCYRPLFNVADNGYLIVDDRPGSPIIDVD